MHYIESGKDNEKMGSELEMVQQKTRIIALSVYLLSVVAIIIVSAVCFNKDVLPIGVLVVLQTMIALLLREAELWFHGVLVIAEMIAGIYIGETALAIMFAVLYVVATFAIKYIYTGEN